MAKVLLDENLPVRMRLLLPEHDVMQVDFLGWDGLANGKLLAAAEGGRFDVSVTADQNIVHQQNFSGRSIAVLVLHTNRWSAIYNRRAALSPAILAAQSRGGVSRLSMVQR